MRLGLVLKHVLQLAEKYPDAIYKRVGPGCSYISGDVIGADTGRKGCIFGQALLNAAAGPNTELHEQGDVLATQEMQQFLELAEKVSPDPTIANLLQLVVDAGHLREIDSILTEVQHCQDVGLTWGRAVKPLRTLLEQRPDLVEMYRLDDVIFPNREDGQELKESTEILLAEDHSEPGNEE